MNRDRKPKSSRRVAIAVIVCGLIALLWPASYFWSDGVRIRAGDHRIECTTGPGWIVFTHGFPSQNLKNAPRIENFFVSIDATWRSALSYTRIYSLPGDDRFYFPFWMLSLSAALVAAALIISHLRRRRNDKPGSCSVCGYDLRATPDRCPECGTPPQ